MPVEEPFEGEAQPFVFGGGLIGIRIGRSSRRVNPDDTAWRPTAIERLRMRRTSASLTGILPRTSPAEATKAGGPIDRSAQTVTINSEEHARNVSPARFATGAHSMIAPLGKDVSDEIR